MTAPAGTSSDDPDAASLLSPHPAAKLTGSTRTAMVRRSLRTVASLSGTSEPDRVGTHPPRTVRLDQRQAESEVLDRKPRGIEQRNPIGCGTARMGTREDGAQVRHVLAAHEAGLDR